MRQDVKSGFSKYAFSDIIKRNKKRMILVIYDVQDNKRRYKIARLLECYGRRVQRSAFELLITPSQYTVLIKQLSSIAMETDNIRTYRLNSSNEVILIGNAKEFRLENDETIII